MGVIATNILEKIYPQNSTPFHYKKKTKNILLQINTDILVMNI